MARCLPAALPIALLVSTVVSCSAGIHPVDRDLAELREHLEEGRYAEAWEGLAHQQREQVAAEAFARALEKDPGTAESLIALLDQALKDPSITYSARVTFDDGTEVIFVLEEGKWILVSPVTTFYGQSTPREALESFIRAFNASRWDVLADLMPSKYSTEDDAAVLEKAWGDPSGREAMARLVKVIEDHLGDDIDVKGNQAVLRYPEGQVTFMRESGHWVILDLD